MLRTRIMPKTNLVYLDNAATTEVDEHVLEKYNEVAIKYFANTSSIHGLGQEAFNLLEKARKQIIKAFDLENTHEVVFTSGATEANNLAIKGAAFEYSNRGKHIIVSEVEHPSVLEVAKQLKEIFGFDVEYLPVTSKKLPSKNSFSRTVNC